MNCCGRSQSRSGQRRRTVRSRPQRKCSKLSLCSPTTTQVSRWCFLVMHLSIVLELCYHTLVTAGRKCQSHYVSLGHVSDATPNWIRRGCQWFLAHVNSTSIWKGISSGSRRIISPYWGCSGDVFTKSPALGCDSSWLHL